MDKYLEDNSEIAVKTYEDAVSIQLTLVRNGYAVMMTQEEDLWILNWVWCDSGYSNRNDVVFRNRGSVECEDWARLQKITEDDEEESGARLAGEVY